MLTLYRLSGPIRKNVIVNKFTVYLYADIFKKTCNFDSNLYSIYTHVYV